MLEGSVVIDGVDYGRLTEVEIAPGVWGIIEEFRLSLIPHLNSRKFAGEIFKNVRATIVFDVAMVDVYAIKRDDLESVCCELSKVFPDIRAGSSSRIFQRYKAGQPAGVRKKLSDFYSDVTEARDAEYSW